MSWQLRTLMDGQRRLLHDVSHELRSPLARLQAAIGLAQQRPGKAAASLARIERESVRIDKLVGQLLTLSRLEASPIAPLGEAVDNVEMLEAIAEDSRFEAGPDVAIVCCCPLRPVVVGDPDLLVRSVETVVRNAVKHGGGNVDIRCRTGDSEVHIDVLDRGPKVADGDLAWLFQPFFKVQPAYNNVDGHGAWRSPSTWPRHMAARSLPRTAKAADCA